MRIACCLVAASLFFAIPARADETIPPEAKARMDEGYQLLKKRKNTEAKEKFLQSLALFPSAKALGNLAAVEEDLGQYAEALGHLKALIAHPKAPSEDVKKVNEEYIPMLMKRTGHIRVLAADGQGISVDGKLLGTAPLADTIDVNPGAHTVVVAARSIDTKLEPGQSVELDFREPKTNSTVVTVKMGGGHDHDHDPHGHVDPPPQTRTETYRPTMGYVVPGVLLGVSAVGLAGGIGFGAASSSAKSDAENLARSAPCQDLQSANCAAFRDKQKSRDASQTLSLVSYTVSGAFLVGAVVSYIVWPKSTREVAVRVVPTVGGLQVVGNF